MLHVMEHTTVAAGLGSEFVPEPPEMVAERVAKVKEEFAHRMIVDSRSRLKIASDVVHGPIGATIEAYAGDNHFDVIVMGTHGRRGLAHLLMGSVAESVIRTAPCPVLTVKAPVADHLRHGPTEPASVAV
jgi:nucleotide-binding universal stress UspA family protein